MAKSSGSLGNNSEVERLRQELQLAKDEAENRKNHYEEVHCQLKKKINELTEILDKLLK